MTDRIPQPVQETVRSLAARCAEFTKAAESGSWISIQTWLLSMQPEMNTLLDIGLDGGIRGAARMDITPEVQERIAKGFKVPNSLEGETQ